MNKNNIIGLVIIVAMLIGYSIWMSPSKEQMAAARKKADSVALIQKADSTAAAIAKAKQNQPVDSTSKVTTSTSEAKADTTSGDFSRQGNQKFYTLESDLMTLKIASRGGRIWSVQLKNFQTFDTLPLVLFQGDTTEFGFEFNTEDLKSYNTGDLYFVPSKELSSDTVRVSGKDSIQFAMRLYPGKADPATAKSYLEYVYTLHGNDYMVGYTVNFVGMKSIIAGNTADMLLTWNSNVLQQEKSFKTEQSQTTIHYMDMAGEVSYLKETKDDKDRLTSPVKWVSFKQQFFSSTLIASDKFLSADIASQMRAEIKGNRVLKSLTSSFTLPYTNDKDQTYNLQWYFGPNKYKTLRQYKLNLERQIPLGWSFFLMQWINRFAVLPVFNWLEASHINYGIIILILTVLLKIVLFPIAWKTYISSAKMRILKPEIDEINAKYPKQDDAMKKQQATMTLYKKAGVNPMAGCVPMLLQFPILIAMFRFFPSAFELRQQPFLWAHDLSSYDSILNLGFNIPFYGDHVSLFCLLMTISTIIYTKINNDMMGSTQQMPGMKTMMYLMPIMFLGFFNNYSAGLSYYYLLANLFTFAQMYIIRRFVNEDKLHARIQENKKKPVQKSGFQKRLEEMTKQQQANMRRK